MMILNNIWRTEITLAEGHNSILQNALFQGSEPIRFILLETPSEYRYTDSYLSPFQELDRASTQ